MEYTGCHLLQVPISLAPSLQIISHVPSKLHA
jgi:hypothetical protein